MYRNQLEWSPNRSAFRPVKQAERPRLDFRFGGQAARSGGIKRPELPAEITARVAQSLIEDIAAGKFPVGSLIATEADLCERFGVSRNTARAALAVLSDMGLVTRHARHRHFCPQCDRRCPLCSGSRIGFRAISEYRSDRAADAIGMHGQGRCQPCQVAGLPARRAMETNRVAALDPEAPASGSLLASLSATAFGEFEQAFRSSQGAGLHRDRSQIQIACFQDVPGDQRLSGAENRGAAARCSGAIARDADHSPLFLRRRKDCPDFEDHLSCRAI